MNRGMKVLQQKLKMVDIVIEVHDARIPLSGRNPKFKDTVTGLRPHVLVLNKADLTDPYLIDKTVHVIKKDSGTNVIFTNCKDPKCDGINQLLNTIKGVTSENRFNRIFEGNICAMIVGVPNVGKSSLINALRIRYLKKTKAVTEGPIAGITRSVGSKIKICDPPLIYMFDSPGILLPSIPNVEAGMKLALCATFKDAEVGLINIADYLLYWLNKHELFNYVSYLNLKEPTDDIIEVLVVSAANLRLLSRKREFGSQGGLALKPDLDAAAHNFISAFRKGTLGYINLDCDMLC